MIKKFGGFNLKIKNKLFATLLILVFIVSVSTVVAEDTADVEELAVDNSEDIELTSEDDIEPLTASGEDDDESSENLTSIAIRVDVLDKVKVGDLFRLKVTVINWGDYPADNVQAGFSFTDLLENPDSSFILVDDGGYAVFPYDGGYVVEFGFLGAGESQDVILTFLATEAGTKKIFALVTSDNSIMEPDNYFDTTITVSGDDSGSGNNNEVSAANELLPTGNPIAILAMALLCCIVPLYRRK